MLKESDAKKTASLFFAQKGLWVFDYYLTVYNTYSVLNHFNCAQACQKYKSIVRLWQQRKWLLGRLKANIIS